MASPEATVSIGRIQKTKAAGKEQPQVKASKLTSENFARLCLNPLKCVRAVILS